MEQCPIPLTEEFIPKGRNNRPGVAMVPEWITIHDTGNSRAGANAKAHASYLKGKEAAAAPVSWHFTVDDHGAYQHLPLSEHGWHAGDGHGPGNMSSVGIEICENVDGNRGKAEENAAKLTAWLLVELRLDASRVVKHQHWYPAKQCPRVLMPRWGWWIAEVNLWMAAYKKPVEWDPVAEIQALREKGLINGDHDPRAPVTWGELATVINRLG